MSVYTDVDNLGTAASGSFAIQHRLSSDSTINSSDRLIQTVTRSSIAARGDSAYEAVITAGTSGELARSLRFFDGRQERTFVV